MTSAMRADLFDAGYLFDATFLSLSVITKDASARDPDYWVDYADLDGHPPPDCLLNCQNDLRRLTLEGAFG